MAVALPGHVELVDGSRFEIPAHSNATLAPSGDLNIYRQNPGGAAVLTHFIARGIWASAANR